MQININDSNWIDGVGARNFKSFFKNFVDEFMKNNVEYYKKTKGDLAYTYREKQLNTVIVPALHKLSDVFLCEHPIGRNAQGTKGNDTLGWLDYWVKYKSTDFNIELKHGYHGLQNKNQTRESTCNEWETAKSQLKKITNHDHAMNSKVLNIALMVIITYTSQEKYEGNMSECKEIGEIITKAFNLEDYILANIIPNKEMTLERCEYEYGGIEAYPYIHILAENI